MDDVESLNSMLSFATDEYEHEGEDEQELEDDHHYDATCSNCRRKQFSLLLEYKMVFHNVLSNHVRKTRHSLKKIMHSDETDENALMYTLCQECYNFLSADEEIGKSPYQKKRMADWKNTWPAFFWDLLSGTEVGSLKPIHEIYSPLEIWKFIPTTMRPYWEDAIATIQDVRYLECSSDYPASYFRDCTLRIKSFRDDV